jgi:predicted O-linked N-acetylglucosamine transferase (SPINDLY family)
MDAEHTMAEATARHRAGDRDEARRLYEMVLAAVPGHATALFRSGLLEFELGHGHTALARIEQAMQAAPGDYRHHFGLGQVLHALGRHRDAGVAFRRGLDLEPQSADGYFALGGVLQADGDDSGAIAAYEAALARRPDFGEALNNLGTCLQRGARWDEAAAAYEQVLRLQPDAADALANLGVIALERGRVDEAVQFQARAARLRPQVAAYSLNLGIALCRRRDFAAALAVLEPLSARAPGNAEARFNAAIALHGLGRLEEAALGYRHATQLRARYAEAYNNLGNVYKELGDFTAAAAAYEAAIGARPGWVLALNNAGCLMRTLGQLDRAEALLDQAIALQPGLAALHDNLGSVRKDAGALDAAIASFRTALALDPSAAGTHSNLVYALSFQCAEAAPILAEARVWSTQHAAALEAARRPPATLRDPEKRLRIGYVSPDFRDHCQSLFTIPLLSHHDRGAQEIFCYASVERPDAITQRLVAEASVWRDVRRADDATLAEMIRADGIDILVDLTMHMGNGRPLLFARKPAPVQVAWLAYPGTTGLAAIDYRISDPRLDPPQGTQGGDEPYVERTWRLPDSFWCYDPLTREPEVGPLPVLTHGRLTFGCLNNPCKLTAATLQLWGDVMRAVPAARLLLMAREGRQRDLLRSRLAAVGVDATRLEFVPYQPRAQYLRTYREIDVGLDTLPYNGHTTSLDSLWMGVPVISRIGRTCVGRGGLSQLYQVGLPELACETDAGFTAAAVGLAQDLPRLAALRAGLRGRLERSPLMDAPRFARHLEAAYRAMWRAHCANPRRSD